ncbi:hypothetical protein Hamer_G030555 [Homarus americanus]|uniref:Uncharacterized protein n=1 Tax=Homarus americanus TaxID=6706 RepID=A0A8J5JZN5_HOMAM|nr:hypothetical protein Hamer_G030555 [Homarus americanus]
MRVLSLTHTLLLLSLSPHDHYVVTYSLDHKKTERDRHYFLSNIRPTGNETRRERAIAQWIEAKCHAKLFISDGKAGCIPGATLIFDGRTYSA